MDLRLKLVVFSFLLNRNGELTSSFLSPLSSIRENLCNTLTRKFIDEMKIYQNAQQKYKTDIKKKVTRQVQIVKPDATDEEVDMVMMVMFVVVSPIHKILWHASGDTT